MTTTQKIPQVANSSFRYWDIESLDNVFTLAIFDPTKTSLQLYYLLDNIEPTQEFFNTVSDRIASSYSQISRDNITYHNLATKDANLDLVGHFGLSNSRTVNDPNQWGNKYPKSFRVVCDTDPDYNSSAHPFYMGYNSTNYDTTILVHYLVEVFGDSANNKASFQPTTASSIRAFNNRMFSETFINSMTRAITYATNVDLNDIDVNASPFDDFDPDAKRAPNYSDERWVARKAMLMSGRFLDVSNFNEKQSRVALKRLLGMLGYHILESDKLSGDATHIENLEELADLFVYNVSDVVNLEKLFIHPSYSSAFDLKAGLLAEYPELIYEKKDKSYQPDIRPSKVRRDRQNIDSTSATFATKTLAPYHQLEDDLVVTFNYPHPRVAKEKGVPVRNVLQDAKDFFYDTVKDETARREFDKVYDNYKQIEGKNFNDSGYYFAAVDRAKTSLKAMLIEIDEDPTHYGLPDLPRGEEIEVSLPGYAAKYIKPFPVLDSTHPMGYGEQLLLKAKEKIDNDPDLIYSYTEKYLELGIQRCLMDPEAYPKYRDKINTSIDDIMDAFSEVIHLSVDRDTGSYPRLTIPYYHQDGTSSSGYANFSTGGIHGAEYNKDLYNRELAEYTYDKDLQDYAKELYNNDPVALRMDREFDRDGQTYPWKSVLGNATIANSRWKTLRKPELFIINDRGSITINPRYSYTTAAPTTHEDFTSYYPMLLTNLGAFYNKELGQDRYSKVYDQKESYGALRKDPNLSQDERDRYNILREGAKLILNSASGAADATFDNNIRMNNRTTAMRIIGQLKTWTIAQAQTAVGALIPSTNTDGIYSVLEPTLNNEILEREQKNIGVEIEPERMFLITKDSNSRMELIFKNTEDEAIGDIITAIDQNLPMANNNLQSNLPTNTVDRQKWIMENIIIVGASGGTLACWRGPNPSMSMTKPAFVDTIVAYYLIHAALNSETITKVTNKDGSTTEKVTQLSLTEKMDKHVAKRIALYLLSQFSAQDILKNTNVVVSSSWKSRTYNISADFNADIDIKDPTTMTGINHLQHYSRVFYVKPDTPNAKSLIAAYGRKITPAQKKTRKREGLAEYDTTNTIAIDALAYQGVNMDTLLREGREPAIKKITNIDPAQAMIVVNEDLHLLPDNRQREILESLDIDAYIDMAASVYNDNWVNRQ